MTRQLSLLQMSENPVCPCAAGAHLSASSSSRLRGVAASAGFIVLTPLATGSAPCSRNLLMPEYRSCRPVNEK